MIEATLRTVDRLRKVVQHFEKGMWDDRREKVREANMNDWLYESEDPGQPNQSVSGRLYGKPGNAPGIYQLKAKVQDHPYADEIQYNLTPLGHHFVLVKRLPVPPPEIAEKIREMSPLAGTHAHIQWMENAGRLAFRFNEMETRAALSAIGFRLEWGREEFTSEPILEIEKESEKVGFIKLGGGIQYKIAIQPQHLEQVVRAIFSNKPELPAEPKRDALGPKQDE